MIGWTPVLGHKLADASFSCREKAAVNLPHFEHAMSRIEKLKVDVYSFEELDTLEKNATKLRDQETLSLIAQSRASKKPKVRNPRALLTKTACH